MSSKNLVVGLVAIGAISASAFFAGTLVNAGQGIPSPIPEPVVQEIQTIQRSEPQAKYRNIWREMGAGISKWSRNPLSNQSANCRYNGKDCDRENW